MVKLPSIRTSPLKRPAMRTLPEPSILPSMVRLAAITDSPPPSWMRGAGRRGAAAGLGSLAAGLTLGAARSGVAGSGRALATGCGAAEPGEPGVGFSFQSAINNSPVVNYV